MSVTLSGLSRRVQGLAYDRETLDELKFILEEAQEPGGDAADALIELALAPIQLTYADFGSMLREDVEAIIDGDDDSDERVDGDGEDVEGGISDEDIEDEADDLLADIDSDY